MVCGTIMLELFIVLSDIGMENNALHYAQLGYGMLFMRFCSSIECKIQYLATYDGVSTYYLHMIKVHDAIILYIITVYYV